jgi:hypothetical protein
MAKWGKLSEAHAPGCLKLVVMLLPIVVQTRQIQDDKADVNTFLVAG